MSDDDTHHSTTKDGERSPMARSRVGNGSLLFLDADGRSREARRWRDVYAETLSDLGSANLSEGQKQIAKRCATLAVRGEMMESDLAAGRDFDLEAFLQLTNALGRAWARLGLKRQQRDVTPSLREYVDAQARTVNVERRDGSVVS